MAVPASSRNLTSLWICRIQRRGVHGRGSTADREVSITRKTAPDQIWNRGVIACPLWLNVGCSYGVGVANDFLLKIADYDIKRAPGDKISRGVIKARLRELPVGCGARKEGDDQHCQKHDE